MTFSGDFLSGLLNTSNKAHICNPDTGEAEARESAVYQPKVQRRPIYKLVTTCCPGQGALQQLTAAVFLAGHGGTRLYSQHSEEGRS